VTTAELLADLDACGESFTWAADYPDPRDAWDHCPRGDWLLWVAHRLARRDWLLWVAHRLGVSRKLVVLAACDCARTALRYVPEGEGRPRLAIETAEAWCRGEATEKEAREAANAAAHAAGLAADAAAYAANATYAANAAAHAAAHATYAAAHAANATYAAAGLATAAATAATAAATAANRRCADLVRARIPWEAVAAGLKGAA
jgi:hypothetical protein